ncbi:hypothetical protein GCM10009114_35210 [Aliiglaciecola litoralis]|uniref:Uncharacterized protein n=1 Tax=Aliiglaciecola litoralis TaxID=582857 RepID=A0ABN1LSS6_9ALTE
MRSRHKSTTGMTVVFEHYLGDAFVVPEALLVGDLRKSLAWFNYKQESMRSRHKSTTGMTIVSEHYRGDPFCRPRGALGRGSP